MMVVKPIFCKLLLVTGLMLLWSCSDGGGKDVSDADLTTDTGTDMTTGDAGADTEPVPAPVIMDILVTENPNNVLSAILDVQTDIDATVTLVIAGGGKTRTVTFAEPGTDQSLPVLGMHPETDYELTVTAVSSDGAKSAPESLSFSTSALPDGPFPMLEVLTHKPEQMEPGITIFSSMILQLPLNQRPGLILATDSEGTPLWYHSHPNQVLESFTLTKAGTILYLAGTDGAREMNMLGKTLKEWKPESFSSDDMEILGVHHDIIDLPDDNIVAIGIEMRDIEHEVEGEMVTHHVIGDVILEWTREGELVHSWSTFDFLDPQYYKEDFHDSFWDLYVDVAGGTKNWTHCNAILYDESDDSFVLSLRHLDWIVKISRESGELLWTMGEGGDFTIAGEGEWFYHQHAPMLLEPGRIILFDNGNLRPEYELATFFTRTLEFTYDEAGKTFSEAWKWQDDEPFYSQYVGDSDRLGNTNVLIGDGGRVEDQSQPLTNPFNLKWYRIVEVTDNKEVVWEMQAQDFSGDVFGYSLYRAQRWSSIYPEVIATEE